MDKLKQIEAFIAVVEHGSMAAAALTQDMTPVMIGRRINTLETRLGVKLLHRSTYRTAVTEQGVVFVEQYRKALGELDRAELLVAEGRHKATGHLTVSAPAAFDRKHVTPHAPDFLHANPNVRIPSNLTDRVIDPVREGYDVSIRIDGVIGPNFVAIRLVSDKRVVCGTPAYFAKRDVPRMLDDLTRHNCLTFDLRGDQQRGWYFQQNGKAVTVKVNGNLDCNGGELLHRWMGGGLGLGWHSTWEVQPELGSGALMTVLDDYTLLDYDILTVYPQQRPVPTKIRFFIEHLKTVYGRAGYWSRTA